MLGMDNLFVKRIAIGKMIGMAIGLLACIMIGIMSDASLMLRLGVLFWYTTFGAFIALAGIMDEHPALHFKMPFWLRGIVFGGWMNLVLVMIAYPVMNEVFVQLRDIGLPVFSPFLLVLEGMIVGVFIDYLCTKFAGEGTRIIEKPKKKFGIF